MTDPHIPERDTGGMRSSHNDIGVEQKAAQQRRVVSKLGRDELEDKYLRLYEENIILKKHARRQEEKIKKMATKLLRLASDKKKSATDMGGKIQDGEVSIEFQDRLRQMERQNAQLKEQLNLARQQISVIGKRPTHYVGVPARIDTGIQKTVQSDPRLTKNLRVVGPVPEAHRRKGPPPQHHYGHSLLEETRVEKQQLENLVAELEESLNVRHQEAESLKEQLRLREAEYEEDTVKLKQKMTAEQRANVQENIDLIKLQREVKAKASQLVEMQDMYSTMENNMRTVKHSHEQVLVELERLNVQLKEEQNKALTLQNELKRQASHQKKNYELEQQLADIHNDNQILKEANENLVSSAFDLEREREWRQREQALKVQIAQLEATLKSDLGEKGSIIDRYSRERDGHEKLQTEFRVLQVTYFQQKEQLDDLQEKMKFFTKESAVDFTEIEEALVLVKQKKQQESHHPDFLTAVDDELNKDYKKQLLEVQAEFAETVHELEKTRNMLVVQHKINKDYQTEVDLSSTRLNELKAEYELKLDEYARLLDIRAARIKKLEAQLRDVAYGTRQYKTMPPADDVESTLDFDETIHLERGQNLFEVHIHKASLTPDGIKLIGDEEPLLFCTFEFYEFEIQSTPVVRGPRPEFDFTSQYIVKVDDFFLHHLQKESCTLELHQSYGQDFRTVGACQLVFKEIFDKAHGRIHGVAHVTGMEQHSLGLGLGTVEYWVRLRVPMEQALRLYKERTKALGYITSNEKAAKEALQALDETAAKRPADNINELHIKIVRCSRIKARRENIQPSPYCVYQFFDFNDHDTSIVPNTNNPEIQDHQTYPVPMTADLDQYLKTVHLKVFVFDDTDPEEAHYLGVALVPLIPLAHNKPVKGIFELKDTEGKKNGTVEVELRWQYTYVAPKLPKHEPIPMDTDPAPLDPPQRLEPEPALTPIPVPQPSRRMGAKFPPPHAASTPMAPDMLRSVEEQIIMDSSDTSVMSPVKPQPKARRRLESDDSSAMESQTPEAAQSAVKNAVSEVVSGFMVSESMASTTEPSARKSHLGDSMMSDHSEVEEEDKKEVEEQIEEEIDEQIVPEGEASVLAPASEIFESGGEEELRGKETPKSVTPKSTPKSTPKVTPRASPKPSPKQTPTTLSLKDTREDTFFGDEPEEEEISEEITEEITDEGTLRSLSAVPEEKVSEESEAEPMKVESDSEGLVMVKAEPKRNKKKAPAQSNSITIGISHFSLEEHSRVMENPKVKQLYVEFKFLGVEPQETETPYSLPKPRPHAQVSFNFSTTIAVDMERHLERRRYLASMLLPGHPEEGRIRFTVVSEPPEDQQDEECEDVGVAFVSVRDILKKNKDIKDQDIDILDVRNEKTVIGSMNVTVDCLAALQAVEKEIQVDGTY